MVIHCVSEQLKRALDFAICIITVDHKVDRMNRSVGCVKQML